MPTPLDRTILRDITDPIFIRRLVERVATASEGQPVEQGALACKVSHASLGDYFIERKCELLDPPAGSHLKIQATYLEGRDFMRRNPDVTDTDRTYFQAILFRETNGNWCEFSRVAYATTTGTTPTLFDIRTGNSPQDTARYFGKWLHNLPFITSAIGPHTFTIILPADQIANHTTKFRQAGGIIMPLPVTSAEYMNLLASAARECGLEVKKEQGK